MGRQGEAVAHAAVLQPEDEARRLARAEAAFSSSPFFPVREVDEEGKGD